MRFSVTVFALLSLASTVFASELPMPTSDRVTVICTAFKDGDGPMWVELTKKLDKDGGATFEGSQEAFKKKFDFVYVPGIYLEISTKQNGVRVATRSNGLGRTDVDGGIYTGVYLQVGSDETGEAVSCYKIKDGKI